MHRRFHLSMYFVFYLGTKLARSPSLKVLCDAKIPQLLELMTLLCLT
jgi:hypothetical protein